MSAPIEFTGDSPAIKHDDFSRKGNRPYLWIARHLAGADQDPMNGRRILEIGSRTGNPAIEIAEAYPNLAALTSIQPSRGFEGMREIAEHKFGKRNLVLSTDTGISQETIDFVKAQRQKALPHSDKVTISEGGWLGVDKIAAGPFDRAFYSGIFHWVALETPTSKPNLTRLAVSASEVASVLNKDGQLLLDTNGHICTFGEEEVQGRKIDDMHFTKHPFRAAFNDAFANIASGAGFEVPITQEEPSPLYHMLSTAGIKDLLDQSGFNLVPSPEGRDFHIRLLSNPLESIIAGVQASATMGHFRKPELADLPDAEKTRWIEEAKKAALKAAADSSIKYYETYALFVARKK